MAWSFTACPAADTSWMLSQSGLKGTIYLIIKMALVVTMSLMFHVAGILLLWAADVIYYCYLTSSAEGVSCNHKVCRHTGRNLKQTRNADNIWVNTRRWLWNRKGTHPRAKVQVNQLKNGQRPRNWLIWAVEMRRLRTCITNMQENMIPLSCFISKRIQNIKLFWVQLLMF